MAVERRYEQPEPEGMRVVGLFSNRAAADDAVDALLRAGFPRDEISLVMRRENSREDVVIAPGTEAEEGAAAGAVPGAVIGGVAGLALSGGAFVIPGVGPVLAAGPLITALGTLLGAAAGAGLGAWAGMGIPDSDADWYGKTIREGGVLVTVDAHGREQKVAQLLQQHGADDVRAVHPTGEAPRPHEATRVPPPPRPEANRPVEPPVATPRDVGPEESLPPSAGDIPVRPRRRERDRVNEGDNKVDLD